MHPTFSWLLPWVFSPTVLTVSVLCCGLYLAGMLARRRAGLSTGFWRSLSFFTGVILIYVVLQTRLNYFAEHMFWIHRLQHLVLHHVGPFLVVIAVPQTIMSNGLPRRIRDGALIPFWRSRGIQMVYRFIQHPLVAGILFVGLIYFWLTPSMFFMAMLDVHLYDLMNWSMVVDGLLFWWLILDPRSREQGARTRYGTRMFLALAVMPPQILIGSYIALSRTDLYTVYALCGRLWPVSPMTDQHIGGLITWIPSCMMSVLAALIVFGRLTRRDYRIRAEQTGTLA